jgi:hypothetical protein
MAKTAARRINLRVPADAAFRLSTAARASGFTLSAWCRRRLLEQPAGLAALPTAAAPARLADAAAEAAAKAEPLSRVVSTKLTRSQHFDLDARAGAAGLTVGRYLRVLIAGERPSGRWPLVRKAIVELSRVGNNLNQLVKLAHQGTLLPADLLSAVTRVLRQVRALRDALMADAEEPEE